MSRAHALGLIPDRPEAAIDATGLEIRHVSAHYGGPRPGPRWPKVTAVSLTDSQLFVGATVTEGPSNDSPELAAVMPEVAQRLGLDRLLADAGFDAESNHVLCRETLGIRSTVIAVNLRGNGPPQSKYRRQMHRRFHHRVYGQRAQVESAFSRLKRVLGSALRARRQATQTSECLLRILTHNLMILLVWRPFNGAPSALSLRLRPATPVAQSVESRRPEVVGDTTG